MPGCQSAKMFQPIDYFAVNEPIYGHVKSKKKSKEKNHLFVPDIRSRDMAERLQQAKYLRSIDCSNGKLESMRFIGSCNDLYNMNGYTSNPRQKLLYPEDTESRTRAKSIPKSSSTMISGKGDRKPSVNSENSIVTEAMLSSLRNSASEDNLYESVEMIHYLKTMQTLNKQKKTRSIQRTGHSLFDSLREEQAMREPLRKSNSKKQLDEYYSLSTSQGNSPSLSPSSSSDEYEVHHNRSTLYRQARDRPLFHINDKIFRGHDSIPKIIEPSSTKPTPREGTSSESDEDFKIIPRPKFMTKSKTRQTEALSAQLQQQKPRRSSDISSPSEESDSSFNSTFLR